MLSGQETKMFPEDVIEGLERWLQSATFSSLLSVVINLSKQNKKEQTKIWERKGFRLGYFTTE